MLPTSSNGLSLNLSNGNVFRCTRNNNKQTINERQQEQMVELLKGSRFKECSKKDRVEHVNYGEEDQMEIYGYKRNRLLTAATWFLIVMTGGTLRLIFHWIPHYMLLSTHSRCPVDQAETVLLVEKFQDKHAIKHVKRINIVSAQEVRKLQMNEDKKSSTESLPKYLSFHVTDGQFREVSHLRTFNCKKLLYVWDAEKCEFTKLRGLDAGVLTSTLHLLPALSASEQAMRRGVYGSNEIIIPTKSFLTLVGLEVLNPFYVFQILSFFLWICDNYVYYAMVIISMASCGIIMSAIQTQRNQNNLLSTVTLTDMVTVLRCKSKHKTETVSAKCLVPGDILVIPSHGCVMSCDAVLLTGNCILNESVLTGESVPVTKTPVPSFDNVIYDTKEHARHTLYSGTRVLQTRYFGNEMVLAVVIRTGFTTMKGGLVRSILYPAPVDFKFEQDSYKFVELLACVASIGVMYTVISKGMRGVPITHIILEALDLITIVVPPALPAAMTVGRLVAQNRLEKKQMYCTSPRAINISGSIDCVCFDKTGTLTEDGLDMWGVVMVSGVKKFQVPVKEKSSMLALTHDLLFGMVTCHEITIIDGQLIGDPLDLKMFEFTGWILEEPDVSDTSKFSMLFPTIVKPPVTRKSEDEVELEIGIVRQFTFTSTLQRMSVITRTLGADHYDLYCKGSPEMIHSLSVPGSIPDDFDSVLQEYTAEGYRVIALAHKSLKKLPYTKVQRMTREAAESDLTFLGLVILENRLKPQTMPVINALNDANIKVVMVTGDNMLTALSVARDCDIIKPGVPVIAVNAVAHKNHLEKPRIYYTKSDVHNTSRSQLKTIDQANSNNSASSLTTVESGATIRNYDQVDSCVLGKYFFNGFKKDVEKNVPKRINEFVFSMTGKTWSIIKQYYPELLPKLCTRGTVFARMSPDQKQQLVQELQSLGYYVAMVGDGANDCGALKAAHTGISLSDTEASVASPFTSRVTDISCVLTVIREGRAALVTSFGIFKYMAGYSLTQFISVILLYGIESNLTDLEFLYIDLFIISIFAFFFSKTKAYEGPLFKIPPLTSLLSATPILSLATQISTVAVFQYLSLWTLRQMSWFKPFVANHEDKDDVGCHENYAIFIVSSIQYIILAVVFSKGRPYRKPIYTNYGLLVSFILLSGFSAYLSLGPLEWLADAFKLVVPEDQNFRLLVLMYGLANFIVAAFLEYFVIDNLVFMKLRPKLHNIDKSRKKFLRLERGMETNKDWPAITTEAPTEPIAEPNCRPRKISEIKIEKQEISLNVSRLRGDKGTALPL